MPAGQAVLKAPQHLRKVEEGGVRGKAWPTEFLPKSWERRVIRNDIVDRHAWTSVWSIGCAERFGAGTFSQRRACVSAIPVLACSMVLPGRPRGQPCAARWQNPRTRPKRLADCPTGSTTHSDRSPAICRRTPVSASRRTAQMKTWCSPVSTAFKNRSAWLPCGTRSRRACRMSICRSCCLRLTPAPVLPAPSRTPVKLMPGRGLADERVLRPAGRGVQHGPRTAGAARRAGAPAITAKLGAAKLPAYRNPDPGERPTRRGPERHRPGATVGRW